MAQDIDLSEIYGVLEIIFYKRDPSQFLSDFLLDITKKRINLVLKQKNIVGKVYINKLIKSLDIGKPVDIAFKEAEQFATISLN